MKHSPFYYLILLEMLVPIIFFKFSLCFQIRIRNQLSNVVLQYLPIRYIHKNTYFYTILHKLSLRHNTYK